MWLGGQPSGSSACWAAPIKNAAYAAPIYSTGIGYSRNPQHPDILLKSSSRVNNAPFNIMHCAAMRQSTVAADIPFFLQTLDIFAASIWCSLVAVIIGNPSIKSNIRSTCAGSFMPDNNTCNTTPGTQILFFSLVNFCNIFTIHGTSPLGQLLRRNANDHTEVSTTINGRSAFSYSHIRDRNLLCQMLLLPLSVFDSQYTRATPHSPSHV